MKKITISIFFLFLISCSNDNLRLVTLNSTLPEIVPLIEEFNKNNKNLKIVLEVGLSGKDGDIFIFRGQAKNSPRVAQNINHLFDKDIKRDSFYFDILNNVIDDNGNITLLPLSYDIPGLIYNNKNITHTMTIDIDTFMSNKDIKFSPFWDHSFILWYYLTSLPEFILNDNYLDNDSFNSTSLVVKNILLDREDSWDEELFNKKYMHLSPELLIEQSKMDYYFYNLSKYISLNSSNNNQISFSTLSRNGLITTTDNMTFVGINKNSKNKKAAEDVLKWLFDETNQTEFIKNNYNGSGLYKLFNGELSTLKKVTSETLLTYYPRLNGLIPTAEIITTPSNLPKLWESLKTEVFMPIFKHIKTLPQNSWEKKYNEYYSDWSKKHNK